MKELNWTGCTKKNQMQRIIYLEREWTDMWTKRNLRSLRVSLTKDFKVTAMGKGSGIGG